jgi:hypothetical protein
MGHRSIKQLQLFSIQHETGTSSIKLDLASIRGLIKDNVLIHRRMLRSTSVGIRGKTGKTIAIIVLVIL